MDVISSLPLGIIETILCLMPIQEAVRTSILSREWRYRWITIPKLVFIENTFHLSTNGAELSVLGQLLRKKKEIARRCKLFNAIHQVLSIHEGPIHEFTLCMETDDPRVEIDDIISHLSNSNTIKILKLDFRHAGSVHLYVLPISLFSLHQLTDMYISNCRLYHERTFDELGCLTTLYLYALWTTDEKALLSLLSSCPLLKRLTLNCDVTTIFCGEKTTIVDLFECLPVIESLSMKFHIVMCFLPERLPKKLPTSLVHLKYLFLDYVCFTHKYGLPFLVLLIRSSPNLEKLKLKMDPGYYLEEDEIDFFTLEDYFDIMLEHLNELEILYFSNSENELDFVRRILATSPVLKTVRIFTRPYFDESEKSRISKILLCSPLASPVVKIQWIPN